MATLIILGIAVVLSLTIIPLTLMLAPKGGVSASCAAGLIQEGSVHVERRIQAIVTASIVLCAICCIAIRALA